MLFENISIVFAVIVDAWQCYCRCVVVDTVMMIKAITSEIFTLHIVRCQYMSPLYIYKTGGVSMQQKDIQVHNMLYIYMYLCVESTSLPIKVSNVCALSSRCLTTKATGVKSYLFRSIVQKVLLADTYHIIYFACLCQYRQAFIQTRPFGVLYTIPVCVCSTGPNLPIQTYPNTNLSLILSSNFGKFTS